MIDPDEGNEGEADVATFAKMMLNRFGDEALGIVKDQADLAKQGDIADRWRTIMTLLKMTQS